jgi:DNA-binding PadR family transcriptional regulator
VPFDDHTKDEAAEGQEIGQRSQTRGVSPLVYELFVLGEVMVQPMYGYWLHEVATRILGPLQPLSWGVLYPLMRRLERDGLLTSTLDAQAGSFPRIERGQPRRIYTITPKGRERFLDLMLTPSAHDRDAPKQFLIKLTKFQCLTPAQRVTVLAGYRAYLSEQHAFYATAYDDVEHNPAIDADERPWILRSIDYQLQRYTAEIAWIDAQMAACQAEADAVGES